MAKYYYIMDEAGHAEIWKYYNGTDTWLGTVVNDALARLIIIRLEELEKEIYG